MSDREPAEISCFDPRDPEQREDDSKTWKTTKNPALFGAHFGKLMGFAVCWPTVKIAADYCDELVSSPKHPPRQQQLA